MNPKTGEIIEFPPGELTGEEAIRRGLVPIPPEDLDRVRGMTWEQKMAWLVEQQVVTHQPDGNVLVQPLAPLVERGLAARASRNQAKRERRRRRRKR